MFKHLSLAVLISAFIFASPAPTVMAATQIDALLLRIDALMLEMELVKREIEALRTSATEGTVLGAATTRTLTQSLEYGETNDDIAKIQKLLSTDREIYPYGVVSGFFGPKTQEAIRNLQTRFGLDPVGVIGPATTELLEGYFAQYPDGNYPMGTLAVRPKVLGASTSAVETQPTGTGTTGRSTLESIEAELDHGEALVEIEYRNGSDKELVVEGDTEEDVIRAVAAHVNLSVADVRSIIRFEEDDDDYDEDDAEDALDDAEDEIEEAEDEIEEAEEDGEDTDYAEDTLRDAEDLLEDAEDAFDDEDYDEAVELAERAEERAEDAVDRIGEERGDEKGDPDEIESIEVEVEEDESEVTVEYEDDDDYEFTVDEDKIDEIIEDIAHELDLDEDDVEDLVEFDFGDVDEIEVLVDDDEAKVEVTYESDVVRRFTIDEDSENDMIEEIADELDLDEDDVEDVIDFDYN